MLSIVQSVLERVLQAGCCFSIVGTLASLLDKLYTMNNKLVMIFVNSIAVGDIRSELKARDCGSGHQCQ